MNGPIERIKPRSGTLAALWSDQIAANIAGQPAAQPEERVIGDADVPQDSFEVRDPENEFPTLDVITQRILNAMREALKEAADAAERKDAHIEAQAEHASPGQPKKDDDVLLPGSHSQTPEDLAMMHVHDAVRKAMHETGNRLLGDARVALSQAAASDLNDVHAVQSPSRFFTH